MLNNYFRPFAKTASLFYIYTIILLQFHIRCSCTCTYGKLFFCLITYYFTTGSCQLSMFHRATSEMRGDRFPGSNNGG